MSVSINVFCFWHWWGIRYRQLLFSKCTYLYNLYWYLESLNWWTISNACSCLFKKCAEIALIFEIFEYSQYIVYLLFLFITWLNICKHPRDFVPLFSCWTAISSENQSVHDVRLFFWTFPWCFFKCNEKYMVKYNILDRCILKPFLEKGDFTFSLPFLFKNILSVLC